jgi:hypothetical protein
MFGRHARRINEEFSFPENIKPTGTSSKFTFFSPGYQPFCTFKNISILWASANMKFTTIIVGILTAKLVSSNKLGKRACAGDNCNRAITGTAANLVPVLSSRLADCASFMEITVIPAPVYVPVSNSSTGD